VATITFRPIYGWGWFQEPNTPVEVPGPFIVTAHSASDSEVIGVVEAPHEFAGFNVRLSVRNQEMDGQKNWNVYLSVPQQGQITGFAESI